MPQEITTIEALLARVKHDSSRTDADDPTLLSWINTYKKKLQRERRLFLADNSSQITMKQNVRSTGLPSNFVSMVAIRRRSATMVNTFDWHGNQHNILKNVVLTPHIRREDFLTRFPTTREDGASYIGAPNDYMLQGASILWGPIPSVDESLFIDYYGYLPNYGSNHPYDEFLEHFEDGFYSYLMEQVFKIWLPDEDKMTIHQTDRVAAEKSLRIFQILREHPMETDLNIPDS